MEQTQILPQPAEATAVEPPRPTFLPPPPPAGDVPVLQKLSSPPFPRDRFPLMGILASVYEHVQTTATAGAGEPLPIATKQTL
jgi:hypothetical protein